MAAGPILIFDKSALQALSVDESVWLDHFFLTNITPVPDEYTHEIDRRWMAAGQPPFKDFAPYAAFVLTVDLVFYLGMAIGQISDRRSNMIDVSYLYYLPFCMVFTSGDKLHARLAPLFMRPEQEFVKAVELKSGLKQLNAHYMQHRAEIERVGLVSYAPEPPAEVPTVITALWDKCLVRRGKEKRQPERGESRAPFDAELLARITQIAASTERLPEVEAGAQPDSVILQNQVPVRRGSWRLMPEGVEKKNEK